MPAPVPPALEPTIECRGGGATYLSADSRTNGGMVVSLHYTKDLENKIILVTGEGPLTIEETALQAAGTWT